MKYHVTCFALLFLLGCQQTGTSEAPKVKLSTELKLITENSFATPVRPLMIGVLGTNWAMRIDAPWDPSKMPTGVLANCTVVFHRGPDLEKYIGPPAGPVRPPIPRTADYSSHTVTNATITAVGGRFAREPNGYLDITVSRFEAGGEWFRINGDVRLRFRGPYP